METIAFENLTEFLLNVIRRHPSMYLGGHSISKLPNFITGYQIRDGLDKHHKDYYFGENGFIKWYRKKYAPSDRSYWHCYFLDEANDNEQKALDIYFKRLEEYHIWYTNLNTQLK